MLSKLITRWYHLALSRRYIRIVPKAGLSLLVVTVLIVLAAASLVALNSSSEYVAGTGPKTVQGYVWDSEGNIVQGANVTVNIMNGAVIRSTLNNLTSSAGLYRVTFGPSDWYEDDGIEISAKYGIYTGTNSTTADATPAQFVNATLGFVIPEFDSLLGVVLITGGMFFAAAAIARRPRS
jgi:hypothetical protein